MNTFTFNSRESYLQYRTIWKRKYAALSQVIRDLKWCRKYASSGTERYAAIKKQHETQWGFCPHYLAIHKYRPMAAAMLVELAEAKVEAQRQYLAKKAQVLANA